MIFVSILQSIIHRDFLIIANIAHGAIALSLFSTLSLFRILQPLQLSLHELQLVSELLFIIFKNIENIYLSQRL
jgi:hypothetical protein